MGNLKLKANRAADKAFLESATPEEIKAAIAEVVQRFCDKQENQAQCEKYEDTVVHNMEVLITSATAQELQVEVGLPNAVDSTRRRLGDEPADLHRCETHSRHRSPRGESHCCFWDHAPSSHPREHSHGTSPSGHEVDHI